MSATTNYRRVPLKHRPWISGILHDKYSSKSILHCDAYVFSTSSIPNPEVLVIDWTLGGSLKYRVALDAYSIQSPPLVLARIHDVNTVFTLLETGTPLKWTAQANTVFARVHKTVILERDRAEVFGKHSGRWARVVTQCHYVPTYDTDPMENVTNRYVPRRGYKPRNMDRRTWDALREAADTGKLPDVL